MTNYMGVLEAKLYNYRANEIMLSLLEDLTGFFFNFILALFLFFFLPKSFGHSYVYCTKFQNA